jgi:hypothetical protein
MKQAMVTLLAGLAIVSTPSQAATPQDMLKNLKIQLYQTLAVRTLDDTSITAFVMALPGIPLDPEVKLDNADDLRTLFNMLNFVPTGDVTGQNSSDKMSDIYLRVLDGHKNVTENPKKPELMDQRNTIGVQLDALRNAYFNYKGEYLAAQATANVAFAKRQPNKEVLQNLANQKKAEWEAASKGNKTQYEDLVSQYNQLSFAVEGGEPWGARRTKYGDAEGLGFPVFSWPRYSSWQSESGWMKVTASSSDLQRSESQSTVQWGGSAGFFGFGGSAGGSSTVAVSQEMLDRLSISFEVKRVLIDRPWLDASVFRSRKWTWTDPTEEMISFGKFDQTKKLFEGRMPLLPTSLILVRRVVLASNWGSTVTNDVRSGLSAGGGFSFGPFRVGGNYGNSSHSASSRVQVTDAGIEIPDVQIIGWLCDILPRSPNP